ncbi:MAG: acyltransferase [Acidobacteriaceae bacterium]|jgi:peptidoglycan/LPS O-acetylase OafA/YrhL|nr:acyltransferase [Acidobacteriaceae bacterium]
MLFTRLRRITRDGYWIPEIDGLRFLSISLVFLFHLFVTFCAVTSVTASHSALFLPIRNGARGVPVFFTISGLVLALPFARRYLATGQTVSLRKYYLRRLTRLEPPYILCVLGCTLLYVAYHHSFAGTLPHLAASLVYLHNIVYAAPSQVNGVLWSLEIEVQFYLIAPLLMQIYRLRSLRLRRTMLVAFTLAWLYAQPHMLHTVRTQFTLLGSLPYFLVGMLAADFHIACPPRSVRVGYLWDIAGLAAIAAIFLGPYSEMQVNALLPASACILCLAALRGSMLRRALSVQWVAIIGGMCYSIYLWHLILIRAIFTLTRHAIVPSLGFAGNFLLQFVVCGMPALALCAVYFVCVERPCMDPKWPSKLMVKLGRRPAEATSLDSGGVS